MSVSANRVWDAALGRIQLQIPRPTYDTWLRNTHALRLDDNLLVVGVPSAFAADWIEGRLQKLILDALSTVSDQALSVKFVVGDENPSSLSAYSSSNSQPASSIASIPNNEFSSEYSFSNFIVGPSNQLAYAASYSVSLGSHATYNPLFLYGGVGLGKTHLMNAIGHLATTQGKQVIYVTAEQFTNEYLRAIRERKTETFRTHYRSTDLLMVDDVQFLNGKEATQDGLFHTFNELYRNGSQLVMSSDRPAGELRLLEARLRSRFEAGLQADLGVPEFETRLAILQSIANASSTAIGQEYLEFIATYAHENVRTLRGVLNRFFAFIEFTGKKPSYDLAKIALGPLLVQEDSNSFGIPSILEASAKAYRLSVKTLLSPQRTKEASKARQLAAYLLKIKLGMSSEEIGETLGKRDRTTINYALIKAEEALVKDPHFKKLVKSLDSQAPDFNTFTDTTKSA